MATDGDRVPTNEKAPIRSNPAPGGDDDNSGLSNEDVKLILGMHAPDSQELDVKPILAIVKDILSLATHSFSDAFRDFDLSDCTNFEISNELADDINKISVEMIHRCRGDTHLATLGLLRSMTTYTWDAKIAITLAAFAIKYGEFGLSEQFHTTNVYAKTIVILKDLPKAPAQSGELKKKFEVILDLLNSALHVTHCIIEFKELPPKYISQDSPEFRGAMVHIPKAVYWIIRSILTCVAAIANLNGTGHGYIANSTLEAWEMIVSLSHKLSVTMEDLRNKLNIQLKTCKDLIEKNKAADAHLAFRRLMESHHIDNMKVLRAMFRPREDQRPLYNGSTRTNERLEVLQMKYVLLLISDLELPQEELNILHMIYNEDNTKRHEYEVLWLPILDPKTPMSPLQENLFHDLRNSMPWFSVDQPSMVEPMAIKYIREEWKFTHMPMLVVLDQHAKVSSLNALPMMWIWGTAAFPFTKERERALWAECQWNIELLADSIDPRIFDWIRTNMVICLYGGEDIDWIRRFTRSTREVGRVLGVPIEMLYVGKRNPKEKVRSCHEIIGREQLSHVFSVKDYYDFVWYFWVRLWSMWDSKKQMGSTVEDDRIMQEIMDVLTFDSSEKGWAIFSRGNSEMTKGSGDLVLPVLESYASWRYLVEHPDKFVPVLDEQLRGVVRPEQHHESWRYHVEHPDKFVPVLDYQLRAVRPEQHCNRLILPGQAGNIPERIVCSECGKTMDIFLMYRCSND